MNREMFVRVASAVLERERVPGAALLAEAIAAQMDLFAAVLDGITPPVAQTQAVPAPLRAAFPSPNPEAMAPPPEPEPAMEPLPHDPGLTPPEPSLITTDTRMPSPDEMAKAKQAAPDAPVRSLRPTGRMKVEDLNRLIQERTPEKLTLDVPMEDGTTRRMVFLRNVISMHQYDSVRLTYYPPNTLASVRESTEVQAVLNIDDVPIDLPAVLKKLKEDAVASIRPKRIPVSVAPSPTSGPVQHSGDTYRDPAQSTAIQNVFNSLG